MHKLIAIAVLAGCHKDQPPAPIPVAPVAPAAAEPRPDPTLFQVPREIAGKVTLELVIKDLKRPVLLTVAPGDARKRMFVIEQHEGRIRILEDKKLLPDAFLTISDLSDGNEEGLLGLAFHPDYATNGRLFVNYTSADMTTHIVEYHVSPRDPDRADPASAHEIVAIRQPYSNHNGGNLAFGPDGMLYTGMGDGGSANDPHGNGQNPTALLAKLLKFDVDRGGAKPPPQIVHLGLRNPWRFWFDKPTGDLYIGDVGQNLWENVYVVGGDDHAKHDFGWNIVEGNHCFRGETCDRTGLTPPVADYPHDQGCSVTGGATYRGKALPMLAGRYFYADYCTGLLRSFLWSKAGIRDHWDWKSAIDGKAVLQEISSFGVDADGELYIVKLTGEIYELVPR